VTAMRIELMDWLSGRSDSVWRQANFVIENLLPLVNAGLDWEDYHRECFVIGEHTSKNMQLPVYEIRREDLGLRLVMRNNFHDWKLSVESSSPIVPSDGVFSALFFTVPPIEPEYTGNELAECYFQGFEDEDVFGYYCQDHRRWSACIDDDFRLWTTIFLIMRDVGAVPTMQWRTKESHAAEIEAARQRAAARFHR